MKIYLDLLPQEKKNQIRRNKMFGRILREEILFIIPLLVLIFLLFNIYYILNFQFRTLTDVGTAGKSQEKYQELNKYENKFKQVNSSVEVLTKIQNNHLHWLKVLQDISNLTPDGIYFTDLTTKNYQIFLLGKARTRDDLLKFKGNLEGSSCFQSIDVPLSNLVVKNDVDFQMNFTVAKECLKKN